MVIGPSHHIPEIMQILHEIIKFFLLSWYSVTANLYLRFTKAETENPSLTQILVVCLSIAFFSLVMHHVYQYITDQIYYHQLRKENYRAKIIDDDFSSET